MLRFMVIMSLVTLTVNNLSAGDPVAGAQDIVQLRIRSVRENQEVVKYVGALLGQAEIGQQVAQFIDTLAKDENGYEGLDLTRPIGLYVRLNQNLLESPVVAMVPVVNEKAVLNFMQNTLALKPQKTDDGIYEVTVPNVPTKVYFRFEQQYLYASLFTSKSLAKASLPKQKEFFSEPLTNLASLKVFIDRIPEDMRKSLFGQFELKVQEALKTEKAKSEDELTQAFLDFLEDRTLDASQALLLHGSRLELDLAVDPKSDETKVQFVIVPQKKSPLAATMNSWQNRATSTSITPPPQAGLQLSCNFDLTKKSIEALKKLYDALEAKVVSDLNNEALAAPIQKLLKSAFSSMLKQGRVEFFQSFTENQKNQHLEHSSFLHTDSSAEIPESLKNYFDALAPGLVLVASLKKKVDTFSLHSMSLNAAISTDFENLFGTNTITLATAPAGLYQAIGTSKDVQLAKRYQPGKPMKTEMLKVQIDLSPILKYLDKDHHELHVQTTKKVFSKKYQAGQDRISLIGTGGESLNLTLIIKGKAFEYFRIFDELKKQQ